MTYQESRYIVAMLGVRMHYAVPRILHSAGMLEMLCTDGYIDASRRRWLERMPEWFMPDIRKRIMARSAADLPGEMVRSYVMLGLSYRWRLARSKNNRRRRALFLRTGRKFCRRVNKEGWGGARAVYAWNSAALEIFQEARKRGIRTVLEQCSAPHEIECRIIEQEQGLHPGWEMPFEIKPVDEEYIAREKQEWALADSIICPSQFVLDSIAGLGGPVERCSVVPYGVEARDGVVTRKRHEGPLRVLSVGRISLAKGAAYVAEAAELLKQVATFRFVGESRLLGERTNAISSLIEFTGAVPRSEVGGHYDWADVFLLPSLHEGSATVCYEALSHGLPVICTPNTGSVVTDGYDGYVIKPFDSAGVVDRLFGLARNRDLLAAMSSNAMVTAKDYSMASYGLRLRKVLNEGPRG